MVITIREVGGDRVQYLKRLLLEQVINYSLRINSKTPLREHGKNISDMVEDKYETYLLEYFGRLGNVEGRHCRTGISNIKEEHPHFNVEHVWAQFRIIVKLFFRKDRRFLNESESNITGTLKNEATKT